MNYGKEKSSMSTLSRAITSKEYFFVFCLFWGMFAARAANPLDFREYKQKVTMTFADKEDAQKVQLKVTPLPKNYKLAISARWDDTNPAHLRTHKLMVKNGLKGTFFQNGLWALKKDPDYLKKLMQGGCSIGLHTMTHPFLPTVNPNRQFQEYMENRIILETASQSPCNSQVLPYCNYSGPSSSIAWSIGKAMQATGVISSPDVFPHRLHSMGYPPKTMAMSHLLRPGDRNPDLKKYKKQLDNYFGNPKKLAKDPSLSVSMHSWHTKDGLVKLDKAFSMIADNPNWWYCNQNEYGAYRYEALNTIISKKQNGKEVEFTIQRIQPIELGARIPLWFSVQGAKPLSVSLGILQENLLELPHDKKQILPDVYARAGEDGKSNEISFVDLKLVHLSEKKWGAVLKNNSDKAITDVTFTFRFPAVWRQGVIRKEFSRIASGEEFTSLALQAEPSKKLLYYRYGNPYYAVQCDFVQDGKRYRLFADLLEKQQEVLPVKINDAAQIFTCPKDIDLGKLSQPETDPESLGLNPDNLKKRPNAGSGVIAPAYPRNDRKGYYLAVVDFKPVKEDITLYSNAATSWRKGEIWYNGEKLKFSHDKAKLKLNGGVNRIVLKSPKDKFQFLMFNGEKEQVVEFIKK